MSDNHFNLLEMDSPSDRRPPPEPPRIETIELDLTDSADPRCLICGRPGAVDEQSICKACNDQIDAAREAPEEDMFGAPEGTLQDALTAISAQGAANAAVTGIGSMAGGQLSVVGFTTPEGYIQAIRNGVPSHTHAQYISILVERLSPEAVAALQLPGPMSETTLPVGEGIKHVPTGPSIFDRPKAQRAFVVGPSTEPKVEAGNTAMLATELVAGAVAEGHHAIVAWMGTSQTTRGLLIDALTAIGRTDWAPRAPAARSQAGSAIAALARNGLHVRAMRKGGTSDLESGEHVWTVGRVDHTCDIGQQYGEVLVRFRLSGDVLTFTGDAELGAPVVAAFGARVSAETLKSGDVTSWLSRTLRERLMAVRFGALGFLVPARHVAAARELCEAVGKKFGSGWVTGLPVATSDQLRDGIARGLTEEVSSLLERLASERAAARSAADTAPLGRPGKIPSGDIGPKRIETFLRELREIAVRVTAYGQVLGAERVSAAQDSILAANRELENLRGGDYEGTSARFAAMFEELALDAERTGGVL